MNPQVRRSLLDFGPLVLFFIAYRLFDLYAATATIMAAAVLAAVLGYLADRKLHPLPIITALIVLIFGGLTLYLNDKTFIKMKPTMIFALFSAALFAGLWLKRPFIKVLLGQALTLPDQAWRILTMRFALFFGALAALNELIWRNFSENLWVYYHSFGAIALLLIFSLSQMPFLSKHHIEKDAN